MKLIIKSFKSKLLPIIAMSCLFGTQLRAETTSEATKATDYAMIEKASKIMCEFCVVIKEFFNKQNKEAFSAHLNRFATIISSVDSLTSEIQEKVEKTNSVKHKAFLEILNELRTALNLAYASLQTRSSKNIMLTFKNSLSQKFIKNTKTKLENAKKYLTENENNLLTTIIDSSEHILKTLPNDISCACIISNIVKR